MENKHKLVMQILLIVAIVMLSCLIGALHGDYIKKQFTLYALEKHIVKNNLSLIDEIGIGGKYYSNYDFETYNNYFQNEYEYILGGKDCKYYSLNWAMYLEKHNIEYKFIYTDTHIFVMAYNDNGLCFLDLNKISCIGNMELN